MLIIMCGISGSGKSTYIKNHFSHENIVSPDLLRKQLTGDISDQSRNRDVWQSAYNKTEYYLSTGKNVVFDATSVRNASLNKLIEIAFNCKQDVQIIVMKDSSELELCKARIKEDIKNGVDRSNVPDYAVERQYFDYLSLRLPDPLWSVKFPNTKVAITYA